MVIHILFLYIILINVFFSLSLFHTGQQCETDIDECASDPCENGSECQANINSFTCVCSPGFFGTSCSFEINECDSDPCVNGATCVDDIASYQCNCVSGYNGQDCQTEINECESMPCQNGGKFGVGFIGEIPFFFCFDTPSFALTSSILSPPPTTSLSLFLPLSFFLSFSSLSLAVS